MSSKCNFITGDLVHMKIDGEVLESTLGVVTSSMDESHCKILWLDEASSGAQGTYKFSALQPVRDVEWQNELYTDW